MDPVRAAADSLVDSLASRLDSLPYSAPENATPNLIRLANVARQGVAKYRKAQEAELPPEPTITRRDVLAWLAECHPKEPSGADMVEFVCAVLDVSDDVWFKVLETGEVPSGASPTDQSTEEQSNE